MEVYIHFQVFLECAGKGPAIYEQPTQYAQQEQHQRHAQYCIQIRRFCFFSGRHVLVYSSTPCSLKPDNAQKYKKLRAFNDLKTLGLTIFNIITTRLPTGGEKIAIFS